MRYFIGFLVTIGLIIVLIILIFGGGGKKAPTGKKLEDYASTDAQVSMTIDGPVNAASLHQQVRIIVDSNNVTYERIVGYDGNVVDTQLYANTQNSYDVFLHALRHAGFTQGINDPALKDERGYCALGTRYIFELTQGGNTLERYWATTCGNPKTYSGNISTTLTLFENQVPDYQQRTAGIAL